MSVWCARSSSKGWPVCATISTASCASYASSRTIVVVRCMQPRGSGVHLVALGLLQLYPIRHLDILLRRLQAVQNALPHTWSLAPEGVTTLPRMQQLHWLPLSVRQRVKFKIAVLVQKTLNDLAPRYLSDDCQLVIVNRRRHLRSSDNFKYTIISTISHLGDRPFIAAGPRLWNSLPTHARQPDLTLDSFYRKLKTYLIIRGIYLFVDTDTIQKQHVEQ